MKYDLNYRRELAVADGFSRQREDFLMGVETAIRSHVMVSRFSDTTVSSFSPYSQIIMGNPKIDEEARVITYAKGVVLVEHRRHWLPDKKRFRGEANLHILTNNGRDGTRLFTSLTGLCKRYSCVEER